MLRALLCVVVVFCLFAPPSYAQKQNILEVRPNGTISGAVDNMPLGDVLQSLSQRLPLDIRGPYASSDPVSASFSGLSLDEALKRLLRGYNYVLMVGDVTERRVLLFMGKSTRTPYTERPSIPPPAATQAPATVQAPPPPETPAPAQPAPALPPTVPGTALPAGVPTPPPLPGPVPPPQQAPAPSQGLQEIVAPPQQATPDSATTGAQPPPSRTPLPRELTGYPPVPGTDMPMPSLPSGVIPIPSNPTAGSEVLSPFSTQPSGQ